MRPCQRRGNKPGPARLASPLLSTLVFTCVWAAQGPRQVHDTCRLCWLQLAFLSCVSLPQWPFLPVKCIKAILPAPLRPALDSVPAPSFPASRSFRSRVPATHQAGMVIDINHEPLTCWFPSRCSPSPQTGSVLLTQLRAELVWLQGKGKVTPVHPAPSTASCRPRLQRAT